MPPSGPPASTMPFDSMPISFARLRLATIDDRPADERLGLVGLARCRRRSCAARCRRRRVSFISFFDFGTRSAASTLATRRSTFMNSSIVDARLGARWLARRVRHGARGARRRRCGRRRRRRCGGGRRRRRRRIGESLIAPRSGGAGALAASSRGHRASPFTSVRSPDARHAASRSRRSVAGSAGSPTRRSISRADVGITGSSSTAATRTASATSNSTWPSRAAMPRDPWPAPTARVCAMYSLAASSSR